MDMRLEDLAAFGVPHERLKELEKEFAERDAYIDQQLREAAEAREERRRNAVPITPQQRAEMERKVEERDFKRWKAGELQSDWPQPDKAWGHVDRGPLWHIVKARIARAKAAASQSKRPKSLSQQQMQQQQ